MKYLRLTRIASSSSSFQNILGLCGIILFPVEKRHEKERKGNGRDLNKKNKIMRGKKKLKKNKSKKWSERRNEKNLKENLNK